VKESEGKSEKRGLLTVEEKERRHKEGLCLYCGEKGHLVAECPKSQKGQSSATGRATFTFTPDETKNSSTTQESEVRS
jgi:hypothetical protein